MKIIDKVSLTAIIGGVILVVFMAIKVFAVPLDPPPSPPYEPPPKDSPDGGTKPEPTPKRPLDPKPM